MLSCHEQQKRPLSTHRPLNQLSSPRIWSPSKEWERCLSLDDARDPLIARPNLGSGPTIHTAVTVSTSLADRALVLACRDGDVSAVLAALSGTDGAECASIDAIVRVNGRPATGLYLAAELGATAVVVALLKAGADPQSSPIGLRALRPLHAAANVQVARLLLAAKAFPYSVDPREPEPAWYHRQRGRAAIALEVERELQLQRPRASNASTNAQVLTHRERLQTTPLRKAVVPAVSGDELRAVLKAFSKRCEDCKSAHAGAEGECIVCMGSWDQQGQSAADQAAEEPETRQKHGGKVATAGALVELPCGASGATPHMFHARCLTQWLQKKASCPVCRCDVRGMLRSGRRPPPQPLPPRQLGPLSPVNSPKEMR
jgi:hypothetical protein